MYNLVLVTGNLIVQEGFEMKAWFVAHRWIIVRFFLIKTFAIALLALGTHFMCAYLDKRLPFGIITNNEYILALWICYGLLISLFSFGYGILYLLWEPINKYLIPKMK